MFIVLGDNILLNFNRIKLKGSVLKLKSSEKVNNIIWQMTERVFTMGLSLLTIAIISRKLGVENFGIYNLTLGNLFIFMTLSRLGLDHILVKAIVNSKTILSVKSLLDNAFTIRLVSSILFGIIFFIFNGWINLDVPNIEIVSLLLIPSIFAEVLTISNTYFDAKLKSKYFTISKITSLIIGSILKMLVVLYSDNIVLLYIAVSIEFIVLGLIEYLFYNKLTNNFFEIKFDIQKVKSLIEESWPLLLEGLIAILVLRIDLIIIKLLLSNHDLGIFSIVSRMFQIWFLIPVIVVNTFYPSLIRQFNIGINELATEIRKVLIILLIVSVSLIVIIIGVSPVIVELMFGEKYLESVKILQWQSIALVFQFVGILFGRTLIIIGNKKLLLARNILILIVNIVLNVILIPKIGLIAIAISTITAFFIGHILIYFFNRETRHLFYG